MSKVNDFPIYVYAYVSPDDEVVYVGRTYDPGTRNGAHRQRSHWWTPDLTFAVVGTCLGWERAKALEARTIRELEPLANVCHNLRRAS